MNISEEIGKLLAEQVNLETEVIIKQERIKEVKLKIRKLETQKKKFEAILGEGQKGVAE